MVAAFAREINFLRTISQRFTVRPRATPEEKHFVFNPRRKTTISSSNSAPNFLVVYSRNRVQIFTTTYTSRVPAFISITNRFRRFPYLIIERSLMYFRTFVFIAYRRLCGILPEPALW